MLLTAKEIEDIQTALNQGVVNIRDMKGLIHEINLLRDHFKEIHSLATKVRTERQRRAVSADELLSVIAYNRRLAYIAIRNKVVK